MLCAVMARVNPRIGRNLFPVQRRRSVQIGGVHQGDQGDTFRQGTDFMASAARTFEDNVRHPWPQPTHRLQWVAASASVTVSGTLRQCPLRGHFMVTASHQLLERPSVGCNRLAPVLRLLSTDIFITLG